MKQKCVYCNREEGILDKNLKPMMFSQEHILPTSLTGSIENNLLTINNVHEYCNNVAGMFVDAAATKNWFVQIELANNASRSVNIAENPVLPLRFMGQLKNVVYDDKICEFWIGPTGDTIYHFHRAYPEIENLPAMIGVPPSIRRKDIDAGFVVMFIRASNPVWHPTILYSLISAFRKSKLYLGNCNTPPGGAYSDIPPELQSLVDQLKNMNEQTHEVEFIYSPSCETRFIAKVALAVGDKLFGELFSCSADADLLREFMWEKENAKRELIPVRGTGFIKQQKSETDNYFALDGCHVINIMNLHDSIALSLTIYNSLNATVKMGEMKEEYKSIIGEGLCYVIAPGLKKMIGPLKSIEFLNHKFNGGVKNAELSDMEDELNKYRIKPPYNLTEK